MLTTIRVQPAARVRGDFALWAIEQTPMVRKCSHDAYAVPPDLFADMPEDLLVGSLVDGQRYRSPLEDADPEAGMLTAVPGEPLPPVPESAYPPGSVPLPPASAEPGDDGAAVVESTSVGDPEADAAAMVAATPPEAIQRAMDAVTVATELAASNAARDESTSAAVGGGSSDTTTTPAEGDGNAGPWQCDLCPREFDTRRGRDTHRRQAHTEGAR